jgi:hypothetical protein
VDAVLDDVPDAMPGPLMDVAVLVSGVAAPMAREDVDSSIVRPLKVDVAAGLLAVGDTVARATSGPADAGSELLAKSVIFRCDPDFDAPAESRAATECAFSPRSINVLKNCRRG